MDHPDIARLFVAMNSLPTIQQNVEAVNFEISEAFGGIEELLEPIEKIQMWFEESENDYYSSMYTAESICHTISISSEQWQNRQPQQKLFRSVRKWESSVTKLKQWF